jgi:hypothetical protein
MGSLDFISPDAAIAGAFVIRDATAVLDDLLSLGRGSDQDLSKLESELGINVRNDVAAALGGEFAFALDGPALPIPSWKLVIEVNDQPRLQMVLDRLVNAASRGSQHEIRMDRENVGGRMYSTIQFTAAGSFGEIHYTFAGGYLVAAPSRDLVDKALNYKVTGYTLPQSATFKSLLPQNESPNFSAAVYQNLGPVFGSLLSALQNSGAGGSIPAGTNTAESKPLLVCAYAEQDRIRVTSSSGVFGLGFGKIADIGGIGILSHLLAGNVPKSQPAAPRQPQTLPKSLKSW